ncbi:hypothetical protein [Trinickia mobilis]|uniref:hypothetical protein n=1 Tax=Trinickia mobilis TaxID=2816356 RepID=UPI001F5CAB9D|nr:hypothetical protein [Trinickia mobilis]
MNLRGVRGWLRKFVWSSAWILWSRWPTVKHFTSWLCLAPGNKISGGKAKAVTATARKIAVLFYNTLRYGMDYVDPGAAYYEERYRQRVLSNLTRRADSMGYVLQPKAGRCEGVSQEGPCEAYPFAHSSRKTGVGILVYSLRLTSSAVP